MTNEKRQSLKSEKARVTDPMIFKCFTKLYHMITHTALVDIFTKGRGEAIKRTVHLQSQRTEKLRPPKCQSITDFQTCCTLTKPFQKQRVMTYRTGVGLFGNYTCKEYTDGWKYKHLIIKNTNSLRNARQGAVNIRAAEPPLQR